MEYLAKTNLDLAITIYWILFVVVIIGAFAVAEIWTTYRERH